MENTLVNWNFFLRGDNSALGSLYDEIFEPLVFCSIRYVNDPEVARDIVSQLFTELITTPPFSRFERWKKIRDPKAFLAVIVRNKSLDHLRVNSNRLRILENYPSEHDLSEQDDLEKQLSAKLEECISALKDVERKILELHLNGCRNGDIATELNITEKTVRNRLSLTRKILAIRWQQLFTLICLLCL